MVTRQTALAQLAPHLGGRAGDIASGTATTAVLAGLIGYPDVAVDDLLLMPDAANDGDQVRAITAWAAATGTATFASRTDTTYTSEGFILLPREASWTVEDLREAVNETLRRTRRSYRIVMPTIEDAHEYSLASYTWLRGTGDIEAVYLRGSPGLVENEDFTNWHNGSALAPDHWNLAGAGATVARATSFASRGGYTADVTRAGADATLTHTLLYAVSRRLIEDTADIAISVRCRATAANRVRVGINNGTDTTWSSYHTGGSNLETLTATRTLTSAATRIQVVLSVDTGDTTGQFDAVYMAEGTSVPAALTDAGSDAFPNRAVHYQKFNRGEEPILLFDRSLGKGQQLVVQVRRPYAELTADSGSTDCGEELLMHGALYRLFSKHRPGEDRTRLDRLAAMHGKAYRQQAGFLIDRPALAPQGRVLVHGA